MLAAGKMSIFDDSVTLTVGDDSVQVSAYGAHILSWKVDNVERLWLSSLSPTDMSAPVRWTLCWRAALLYFFSTTCPHVLPPRSVAAFPLLSPSSPDRAPCPCMDLRGRKSGAWTKFAVCRGGASQHQ